MFLPAEHAAYAVARKLPSPVCTRSTSTSPAWTPGPAANGPGACGASLTDMALPELSNDRTVKRASTAGPTRPAETCTPRWTISDGSASSTSGTQRQRSSGRSQKELTVVPPDPLRVHHRA